jgi:hypothetical protein
VFRAALSRDTTCHLRKKLFPLSYCAMDSLGAVAGGIGVASFGIQIAESIQNCLRFWRSVRNAPADIGRIVEDLEVLDEILNSVMTYHQGLQRSGNSLQPTPIPYLSDLRL